MAFKKVATYAPSTVRVQLFGIPIEGFSKDGVVSIDREESASTSRKALDGSRSVFVDNNPTYVVSITLMQTSPSNTLLHQLFKIHSKIGGDIVIPITIDDKSNGTDRNMFFCMDTFFATEPSTKYSNQSEVTTWTFNCHNAQYERIGSIETYDIVEQLKHLMSAISIANQFNINYMELADITEIMLEKLDFNFGEEMW